MAQARAHDDGCCTAAAASACTPSQQGWRRDTLAHAQLHMKLHSKRCMLRSNSLPSNRFRIHARIACSPCLCCHLLPLMRSIVSSCHALHITPRPCLQPRPPPPPPLPPHHSPICRKIVVGLENAGCARASALQLCTALALTTSSLFISSLFLPPPSPISRSTCHNCHAPPTNQRVSTSVGFASFFVWCGAGGGAVAHARVHALPSPQMECGDKQRRKLLRVAKLWPLLQCGACCSCTPPVSCPLSCPLPDSARFTSCRGWASAVNLARKKRS